MGLSWDLLQAWGERLGGRGTRGSVAQTGAGSRKDRVERRGMRTLAAHPCNSAGHPFAHLALPFHTWPSLHRAVRLCPFEWTPESGLVTPTHKLARRQLIKLFAAEIQEMAEELRKMPERQG